MMRQLKVIRLLMVSLILSPALYADEHQGGKTYSFGIVPQQTAKRMAKIWTPVFRHIQKKTGIKLQFKTAKDIPEFEKRLAQGKYDFVYMNPYHFTVFNLDPGYKALAVRKDQPIRGIMVSHKNSTFSSLAELENKKLAFPSPAAFAASVLPRAELSKNNVNHQSHYVSSHDSVYLNVAKGLFPAGGGVKRTFNNTAPKVRAQLKILWTSEPFTPHAIAVHPRIDTRVYQKVQDALVAMANDEEGNKLLQSLKIKNGLRKAKDSDWDDVRNLGINLLDQLIKQ